MFNKRDIRTFTANKTVAFFNSDTLINMREIMSWNPGEDDNPIFFTIKRVQQCVWLLIHRCDVNRNILKLFKDIVINGSNRILSDVPFDYSFCTDEDDPDAWVEINRAFDRGIEKINAKLNPAEKKAVLWDSLWEFCDNAGKEVSPFRYPTYIMVHDLPEYYVWLDRVLILVEEAFS